MYLRTLLFCVILFLLAFGITKTESLNLDLFLEKSEQNCRIANEQYWQVIYKFFDPLDFIDVRYIEDSNTGNWTDSVTSDFLKKISESKVEIFYWSEIFFKFVLYIWFKN